MPKIQRKDIPAALYRHLLLRVRERNIGIDDLKMMLAWFNSNPEVPVKSWYKRFPSMTVCGEGALVKTFLTPSQAPFGVQLH